MRSLIDGTEIINSIIGGHNRLRAIVQTLTGTTAMDADMPPLIFYDPGGAAREVDLPPEAKGLFFIIVNTADAAEAITVKDDSGVTTVASVAQAEIGVVFCNGTTWNAFVGVA